MNPNHLENIMQIRLATLEDADRIAAIHTDNWRIGYRGHMKDDYLDRLIFDERPAIWRQRMESPGPAEHVLLAVEEEDIVGFASMLGREDERWGSMLDNLHVNGARKGSGIGERLMHETAAWLEQRYAGLGMYLWVLEANHGARRFYERMGGINAESNNWLSPDGGALPCLRYVWHDLRVLTSDANT